MKYGYKRQLKISFEDALEKVKTHLSEEGFGILTEIDVQKTLKKKIDIDYERYVILGACNPPFAYKALVLEKEIGLLLPCNVVVYEDDKEVFVSAILPTVAMNMVDKTELISISRDIEEKLTKVIDSL